MAPQKVQYLKLFTAPSKNLLFTILSALNKKIAIVQSAYIPWKGYFDIINSADEFIFYDDVEFSRGSWRNRNRIKTPHGLKWLTIPVNTSGASKSRIDQIVVSNPGWAEKHWKTLLQYYGRAPYFRMYRDLFHSLYIDCREAYLSRINYRFIRAVNEILGICTPLRWSGEFETAGGRSERLIQICKQAGATCYLSGPAAMAYLDTARFAEEQILVEWMNYSGYPQYPQLYGSFVHEVTVLDLIFNTGPEAPNYMKHSARP
jgi:hypothetical protein